MTHAEQIEHLQDEVYRGHINNIDQLLVECEKHKLEAYEDVLLPMEWNCCDRCGQLAPSDEFLWLDFFSWDDDNPKDVAMQAALEKEQEDYCAICDGCATELIKKGEK